MLCPESAAVPIPVLIAMVVPVLFVAATPVPIPFVILDLWRVAGLLGMVAPQVR